MKAPKVEIIALGSELLRAEVKDLTANLLSERLSCMGMTPSYQTTVGDDERVIKEALLQSFSRADVIMLIGGLGPTFDDITRATVASFFSVPLVDLPAIRRKIKGHLKKVGREADSSCLAVARIPRGAHPIVNRIGLAPGFFIRSGEKCLFAFPGVPQEATTMFDEEARLVLKRIFPKAACPKSLIFKTVGLSETELLRKLKNTLRLDDPDFECGIYPKGGEVHFRVALRNTADKKSLRCLRQLEKSIERKLKPFLFSRTDASLEEVVGRLLRSKRKTLAVAESCTGGLIGKRITDVAGSSDYFLGGLVAYSNAAKESFLGIPRTLIKSHGAVSKVVALRMAEAVRRVFKADLGAAITGIAGPGAGSSRRPVGTVYIAVATKKRSVTRKLFFPAQRSVVRARSARALLALIRIQLLSSQIILRAN